MQVHKLTEEQLQRAACTPLKTAHFMAWTVSYSKWKLKVKE
jgi:hypothetical protein